jgi:hypothetical protein
MHVTTLTHDSWVIDAQGRLPRRQYWGGLMPRRPHRPLPLHRRALLSWGAAGMAAQAALHTPGRAAAQETLAAPPEDTQPAQQALPALSEPPAPVAPPVPAEHPEAAPSAPQPVRPERPGAPLGLFVPSAGVAAPVEPVWLAPPDAPATAAADRLAAGGLGGQIALPSGPSVVGWFALSAAPGLAGSTLLIGHLDTVAGPAVFAQLSRVRPGDPIHVALADGSTATYRTEGTFRLPATQAAPAELFTQQGPPRLFLLTCYGRFVRGAGGYQDRLIVAATPPSPPPAPPVDPAADGTGGA